MPSALYTIYVAVCCISDICVRMYMYGDRHMSCMRVLVIYTPLPARLLPVIITCFFRYILTKLPVIFLLIIILTNTKRMRILTKLTLTRKTACSRFLHAFCYILTKLTLILTKLSPILTKLTLILKKNSFLS